MSSVDFEAVKAAISVPRALSLIGWKARCWNSERHRGPCVIHPSKPGSRIMKVTSRYWYCNKCKIGGDVLDLWMRLTGITDFVLLVRDLCDQCGIEVPYQSWRRPRWRRKAPNREEAR